MANLLPDERMLMSDWADHHITKRLVLFINLQSTAAVTRAINQRGDPAESKNALDTAAAFKQIIEAVRSGEFLVATRQTPTTPETE